MHCTQPQLIPLRQLSAHPQNPRKITQQDLNRLCDSIRQNGYWEHRPMAVELIPGTEGRYYVLDGNQRMKALRRLKRKDALCCIYSELTDEERTDIILRSNINNGQWEAEMLAVEFEGVDFEAIGLDIELPTLEAPTDTAPSDTPDPSEHPDPSDPSENSEESDEEQDTGRRLDFYYRMMGDYRYPTDNEYEIPLLRADNQPVYLELPFTPWGVEGRYKKGITTYHFYVDDYRFEALYKDPVKLLLSGCRAIVEPNNSIHDQTPVAYGIYQIYRKRYLARYLQDCGLQVWVDLNVSPRFEEYNALGIPQGYNAFFTRGVSGWQAALERHLAIAQRISGLEKPNLCIYGGGNDIKEWAHQRGLYWTPEYMNHGRDKSLKEKYRAKEETETTNPNE